ncbi:MAG: hypothetical protein K9J16_19115, partial [Melioribacteraceae bacterium]|nr:hypothetical protein [Melioribacteraceae bacterium]
MKKIILCCALLTGLIYGQEFPISDNWVLTFTLDKFDQSVYWASDVAYRTKIPELETEEVDFFPLLFFNKSHKCLYRHGNNLYLHDFKTGDDSIFASTEIIDPWFLRLSPNDKYLLYFVPYELRIYGMETNEIYDVGCISEENTRDTKWSSDTSLVIIENSIYGTLIECFPFAGRIDTIFSSDEYLDILSLAFNHKTNKLAFSVDFNTPAGPIEQVRQYDPKTGIFDTLVENSMLNYPCSDDPLIFKSLDWSPKN